MPGLSVTFCGTSRRSSAVEVHPGIHVSSIGTSEWVPDPEVGGQMHVLVEGDDAFAGLSRFVDIDLVGPWTLPVRETILILEGAARIEIADGPTLELRVGDIASIPKGAVTTWHLTLPFKELWYFGRAYDMAGE
jgi:ethanolamine utilization protein EutQ (cupin superfamily)